MRLSLGLFGLTAWALAAAGAIAVGTAQAAPAADAVTVATDDTGMRFSLVAANVNLPAVLSALAKASGWDVRMQPEAARQISITLDGETIDSAVASIARASGYVPALVFVVTPKKEGQSLPDPFKLPMGLPTTSLQLVAPIPAVEALNQLGQIAHAEIEVSPEVKGQATIQVTDAPLSEALDAVCKQVDAVWTLSFRLRPPTVRPTLPTGRPGRFPNAPAATRPTSAFPGGGRPGAPAPRPAAAAAVPTFPDPPGWEKMTPEQKVQAAFKELARTTRRAARK